MEPSVEGRGGHIEVESEVREPPLVRLKSIFGEREGDGKRDFERTAEGLNGVSGEGIGAFSGTKAFMIDDFSNIFSDKALSFKVTNPLTELRIVGELREFSDWTLEREIRDRTTEPVDR